MLKLLSILFVALPFFSFAQFQYNPENNVLIYLDRVQEIVSIDNIESKGCEIIAQTPQGHIICDCYVKLGILHDSKNENYSDVQFSLSIEKQAIGYDLVYTDILLIRDSKETPIQAYLFKKNGDEKEGDEASIVNASFHFLSSDIKKRLAKYHSPEKK